MSPVKPIPLLRLFDPVQANLNITQVFEREVTTNTGRVQITRVGQQSLSFTTSLIFPATGQISVRLNWTSNSQNLVVEGTVSSAKRMGNRMTYTLVLDDESANRSDYQRFVSMLSRTQILLHQKVTRLYAAQ